MSNVLLKKKIAELGAILDNEAPVNAYLGSIGLDRSVDRSWELDGRDVTLDEVEEELEEHIHWLEKEFPYSEIADTEAEQDALQEKDVAAAEADLDRFNRFASDLHTEYVTLDAKLDRQLKGRG